MAFHNRDMERLEAAGELDATYDDLRARDRHQAQQHDTARLRDALRAIVADDLQSIPNVDRATAALVRQLAAAPSSTWPDQGASFAARVIDGDVTDDDSEIVVRAVWSGPHGLSVAVTYDRGIVQRLRAIPSGRFDRRTMSWHFDPWQARRALGALLDDVTGPRFRVDRSARPQLSGATGAGRVDLVAGGSQWQLALRYDATVASALRAVDGSAFDADAKTWTLPATGSEGTVLSLIERFDLDVSPSAVAALAQALPPGAQRHLRAAAAAAAKAAQQLEAAARLAGASRALATIRAQADELRVAVDALTDTSDNP